MSKDKPNPVEEDMPDDMDYEQWMEYCRKVNEPEKK